MQTSQPRFARIWRGRTPRSRADEYESYTRPRAHRGARAARLAPATSFRSLRYKLSAIEPGRPRDIHARKSPFDSAR